MPGLSVLATNLTWSIRGAGAPAAALGSVGDIYMDYVAGELWEKQPAGWVMLLSTASSIPVTLQEAYDGGGAVGSGDGRTIDNFDGGAGPVVIDNSGLNSHGSLALARAPGASRGGTILEVTGGANATGNGIDVTLGGSGSGVVIETASGAPLTASGGPSGFTNAAASNGGVLTVAKSPTGGTPRSGNALSVTNTADATGAGVNVNMLGSGTGVNIAVTGPGAALRIADNNGTAGNFIEAADGASAAVSGANTGRIRYNGTTDTWQVSEDGGAYRSIPTGAYTRDIPVPALGFTLSASAFPGLEEIDTTVKVPALAFSATLGEAADFGFPIPTDYAGTGDITFRIYGRCDAAEASKFISWTLGHYARADGEAEDGSFTDVASGDIAVPNSATEFVTASWTVAASTAAWTVGDYVSCRLTRTVPSGSNLTADFMLVAFTVSFTCQGA